MKTLISDQDYLQFDSAGGWEDDFQREIDSLPGEGFPDFEWEDKNQYCNCSQKSSGVYEQNKDYETDQAVEAFPIAAILPALKTALPFIISALPAIAQTAGSVVQSITKGLSPGSAPKPTHSTVQPGAPAPANSTDQLLKSLLQLLQNQQVMQTLGNLASGIASGIRTSNGNVPPANLLNLVSQLSGSAASQMTSPLHTVQPLQPLETNFPEYVFDQNGQLLIDPTDPVQHAELLAEMIT